jgi:hypothetical protein
MNNRGSDLVPAVAKSTDIGQMLPRLPSENSTSIVDVVSPGTR